MRVLLTTFILCLGVGLLHADSQADLATAKAAFEKVQTGISARVNRLDGDLRTAIWTQYYVALERLQQMEVHQQMMLRHQQDRAAQFDRARSEFYRAFDELGRLLPPTPDKSGSE